VLHAAWNDGLAVFGWRGRALDQPTVTSFASTLFVQRAAFVGTDRVLPAPGRTGQLQVRTLQVDMEIVAEAFSLREWVPWGQLSASLAWFQSCYRLGAAVAAAGQVIPTLDATPTGHRARWRPIVDERVGSALARLAESMPPVVGALRLELAPWQITSLAVDSFVDGAARQRLHEIVAPDPAPRSRKSVDVISRRFLTALSARSDQLIIANSTEASLVDELARSLNTWSAVATGRSPLTSLSIMIRVVPPSVLEATRGDDEPPEDRWLLEILLSPANDPSVLVAIEDVVDQADLLGVERTVAEAAASLAARRVSAIAPLLTQPPDLRPAAVVCTLDEVSVFLRGAAARLEQSGIRVLLPAWWHKPVAPRVRALATVTTTPVTAGGLDTASLATIDWRIALGDSTLTNADIERIAESKHELVYLRGRWVAFDRKAVDRALTAARLHHAEGNQAGAIELVRMAADPDIELITDDEQGVDDDGNHAWLDALISGLADDHLVPLAEPAGFVGTLRPYQQRGLGWLAFLQRVGLGGCLADDMGLGKTAQLLALLAHERSLLPEAGPTLVICPLSVVRNWEREAARFTPEARVLIHHGSERDTASLPERVGGVGAQIVITTYATAVRDLAVLTTMPWARLVADEAQHVKNPTTAAAKALRKIAAPQKIALTGTPVENRLSELWSICDLVNPGLLGSQTSFRETFAVPIERNRDQDKAAQLRQLVQPFVLRRSKADRSLVPELPDKIEQIAWAQLTREQATLYQSVVDVLLKTLDGMKGLRNSIDRRGAILAALTRLKQVCNHPVHYLGDGGKLAGRSGKLARFDEIIADLIDADERAIVFTQYREMGLLLQRHLHDHNGMEAEFLHGGVARARRDKMVDQFQAGHGGPVLVVSLKAGGSGLNLTAASQVVHYDRWWNPAVENQASDRAWRIGQTHTVLVHKMVCQGTIEERIDQLIESKRDLAERVVGAGEGWLTELSTDALRDLLVLRAST
jgi:SNF2 family DNA or RNA helicase